MMDHHLQFSDDGSSSSILSVVRSVDLLLISSEDEFGARFLQTLNQIMRSEGAAPEAVLLLRSCAGLHREPLKTPFLPVSP